MKAKIFTEAQQPGKADEKLSLMVEVKYEYRSNTNIEISYGIQG